jgi:hypothetical protein
VSLADEGLHAASDEAIYTMTIAVFLILKVIEFRESVLDIDAFCLQVLL